MELNKIIFGDNLTILKEFPSDSIDLVYLDPPFFTQTDWTKNGYKFEDKFESIEDYLNFLRIRLLELHRVLKPTGTIYLHCDYRTHHYFRIEMDKIFKNYQTTIHWRRFSVPHGCKANKIFPEISEYILVYTKTKEYNYNIQYTPHQEGYINDFKNPDNDPNGIYVWARTMKGTKLSRNAKELNEKSDIKFLNISSSGKWTYKRYWEDHYEGEKFVKGQKYGKKISNIWTDISKGMTAKELIYPTQKPEKLLERIIKASSNPGDIVLDPFCGSGTICVVAKKLGRNYIGIDQSEDAVKLTEERLDKIIIPKSLWDD